MGLLGGVLKHALFWPATGPKFLVEFSLERVQGVVRDELTDDSRVKAELMELQLELELGDIDDAEYARREAELMRQLREVREWKEHFGMGVSGGLVRVAGTEPDSGGRSAAEPEPGDEAAAERERGPASPSGADVDFELGFDDEA
ncbi:MAG: gas vesicle protein GvpG [Longimicrobiales bacterium]